MVSRKRFNRRLICAIFNPAFCVNCAFHLSYDDQKQMFDVFKAHASSHATLMFNTGPMFGEAVGNYRGDPLYHASLDVTEYEALIAKSGFEVIEHAVNDPRAGGRTVWLTQSRACV